MSHLLWDWRGAGSSRLDRDEDGRIDDPGAAIMDRAYPKMAEAVMRPVLGPLTDQLSRMVARDNPPPGQFSGAWYPYVDKDLRRLIGGRRALSAPLANRYCGEGDLDRCREGLWRALEEAGDELAAEQGPDPAQWRSNATRISFAPGILPTTIRWTNRPTAIHQVMSFSAIASRGPGGR